MTIAENNLNEICDVGSQRVNLPDSFLLSTLAIILKFQAFQRYMIINVIFPWKVAL